MNRSGIFSEWIREYCSPVVLTATTAEVESTSYKNGVYFHELLAAFGHLDGVNAVIRSPGSSNIMLHDAHIRFERTSEARPKPSNLIDELLKSSFDPINIDSFPASIQELKGSQSSSWNRKIEQLLYMRSLSFSESETLSNPTLILSVVSSNDADPISAMQELQSQHHTAQCFLNGQYDNDLHRMYIILHDLADGKGIDAAAILRKMQSKFPPAQTRLLQINSLSQDQLNLQQPDLWTKCRIPICFPHNIPAASIPEPRPINPANGNVVLGARLSIEDFMTLRDFCFALFHQEIVPALERRIITLTRIVTDTRKGVKNVLKSFWRKPREDASSSPTSSKQGVSGQSVRYRYDRIESQILQLADTSFMVKDYETAISMYKLVREDYKSDRSTLHLVHIYLMIALCYVLSEPNRTKDVISHLETVTQLLSSAPTDPPHAVAYYALLTTEIYASKEYRQNIDAAQLLLLSAGQVAKYPILCALLTEKAASYFLLGSYTRRYVLYNIIAGHKLRSIGGEVGKHAIKNFAAALLLHENGRWGDIKAKLYRAIAQELNLHVPTQHDVDKDNNRIKCHERSLLASLLSLTTVLTEDQNVGGKESMSDAVAIMDELLSYKTPAISDHAGGNSTKVSEGWPAIDIHELLVNALPVATYPSLHDETTTSSSSVLEINELPCPEVNVPKLSLMMPFNGKHGLVPWDGNLSSSSSTSLSYHKNASLSSAVPSSKMFHQAEEMKCMSDIERTWALEYQTKDNITYDISPSTSSPYMIIKSLGQRWVEAQQELSLRQNKYIHMNYRSFLSISTTTNNIGKMPSSSYHMNASSIAQIPLGEMVTLRVHLKNKLPMALQLSSFRIDIEPEEDFEVHPIDIVLSARESKEVFLSIRPKVVGNFSIDRLRWNLSELLVIRKSIRKLGPLLNRTHHQRLEHQRAEDTSLKFEVISSCPLLTMTFEGVSEEVLQGQLLKTTLLLHNHGKAPARDIFLKISQPCFVFTSASSSTPSSSTAANTPHLLDIFGQSCTLLRLPEDMIIPPDGECRLQAWLRLVSLGKQIISVLATYQTHYDDHQRHDIINHDPRTSFVSVNTTVIPSMKLSSRILSRSSSMLKRTIFIELQNSLGQEISATSQIMPMTRPSRERISSLGQIDVVSDFAALGLDDDGINKSSSYDGYDDMLEEGSCHIEGLWMLGCGVSEPVADYMRWKTCYAGPAEKIVIPYAACITEQTSSFKSFHRIVNADPTSSSYDGHVSNPHHKQLDGSSSWPIPLSLHQPSSTIRHSSSTSSSNPSLTAIHLSCLLERFIGMGHASLMFRRDIHEAEHHHQLAQQDAQLPRTITQVRKDRQKEGYSSSASTSMVNIALDTFTDDILSRRSTLDDVDDVDPASIKLVEASKPYASSGYPMSADELALLEAQSGSVNIMVIWKCKWQGKIRIGMHNLSHVSLLPPESQHESVKKVLNLIDCLLVGLYHEKSVEFHPDAVHTHDGVHTSKGLLVPVTVQLRSVHIHPVYVNVEVVDRKDGSNQKEINSQASTVLGNPSLSSLKSVDDMNCAVSKTSSRGLIWHCKTKYQRVLIEPYSSISLQFQALISHPGIFDLKRLRVSMCECQGDVNPSEDAFVFKSIPGQSLIEVVGSNIISSN